MVRVLVTKPMGGGNATVVPFRSIWAMLLLVAVEALSMLMEKNTVWFAASVTGVVR